MGCERRLINIMVFQPGFIFHPNNTVSSFTFVDAVANEGDTITIPSTAAIGDFVIFSDASVTTTSTPPTQVNPQGGAWTLVQDNSLSSADSVRTDLWYKVLVSGDPGTTITGMTSNVASRRKILLIFRPNISINSVVIIDKNSSVSTGNPSGISSQPTAIPNINIGIVKPSGSAIGTTHNFANSFFGAGVTQHSSYYEIQNNTTVQKTLDTQDSGEWTMIQIASFQFT